MNDTSSSLVLGLSISWMALTLLGLGRNPSLGIDDRGILAMSSQIHISPYAVLCCRL